MQLQRATSDSAESPGPLSANLPPQIVDQAAGRLCWIAGFVACSVLLLGSSQALLQHEFAAALQRPLIRLTLLGLLFLTIGFIVVQRNGWLSKARILDLGLIYQVVVAFDVSLIETAVNWDPSAPMRGLPAVTAWLLLCGLLLPNATLKVGIAAALSVASWPLAYWINLKLYDLQPLPPHRLMVWMGPLTITGVAMYLINRRTISMKLRAERAEQLGSYQLDYRIGRGGMGEVWRAKHKMLARDAAVKLIRPEVLRASSERQEAMLLKRFEREAQATARLRSPNTVALYDFGQSRDGTIYYVMELLDGIDLQTLVDRFGPLHPGRVVNILIQACESLEEAHRAGLVHRDIKPKNILLCRLGLQHDFVKVLDFGLVKMALHNEQSALTLEGITAGTPAYMPPEIGLADEEVDGRADLYSLGCVAYFLLTGQLVFEESSGMAQAIAHIQKTPLPPSQRTELPVPAGLEAIVLRLLAKSPADRYASAYELGRALRALRDVPHFCPYTAAEWWHTNMPETSVKRLDEEQVSPAGATTADISDPGMRVGAPSRV
jgi:serine/threonine protein kinase